MSAHRLSSVAALAIVFAIAGAAVATPAVKRGDAGQPVAVSSATPGTTITGSPRDQALPGTPGDDVIDGAAGDDTIDGMLGNDFLVEGETGNERRIDGGPGDDVIDGGSGNDSDLRGGPGQDIIFGGRGDDLIDGGPGNDRIDAGDGTDASVSGGEGDDILLGGADPDELDGGPGDDVLIGGGSRDKLDGGPGDDVCYRDATLVEFTFGCEKIVTIGASRASRDLVDESHPGIVTGGATGLAKLQANREFRRKSVSGTELPNDLPGTDVAQAFKARGGDDTVSAGGGDDDVDCGAGNDVCRGGAGDDDLQGGSGDDRLDGDDGNDVIEGGQDVDKIVAGAGDDTIFPGDGDELRPAGVAVGASADKAVDAGPGNDRIYAVGGGADTIDCGDGIDVVDYDGADVVGKDCEHENVSPVLRMSLSQLASPSAAQVKGYVTIRTPSTSEFVRLKPDAPIPIGSYVDIPGKSQLTLAVELKHDTGSGRATASISSGRVKIVGPSKRYPDTLAIRPVGPTPLACGSGSVVAAAAQARGKKRKKKRKKTTKVTTKVVKAHGPVKTVTSDVGAAAVSTSWTTTQTCTGTVVKVTEGVVKVRDLRLRKTKIVSAGESYHAKRRRR